MKTLFLRTQYFACQVLMSLEVCFWSHPDLVALSDPVSKRLSNFILFSKSFDSVLVIISIKWWVKR